MSQRQKYWVQEPRHEHDCDCCTFLGHDREFDLYFCKQGGSMDTVIARFGPDGDYQSGIMHATPEVYPSLYVALTRAIEEELLPADVFSFHH